MALPKAVTRRAEKARELARQQAAQGREVVQQPDPQPNQPRERANEQFVQQEPVQAPAPQQDTAFAPQSGPAEDWETRYKNLRNARNEKLEAERNRAAQLEKQLIDLAAQAPSAPQAESQFALSEDELSDMSEAEAKIYSKMAAKFEDKFKVEEQDNTLNRESAFFAELESVHKNWEGLNADPNFMTWLQEPDGFSGRTRKDTLVNARSSLDSETVISLFSAYLQGGNANQDSEVNGSAYQPAVDVNAGRPNLPVNNGQGVLIISNAEIQAFYAHKNQVIRRKKMTPELKVQFDEQDAQIRLAMKEGRVV